MQHITVYLSPFDRRLCIDLTPAGVLALHGALVQSDGIDAEIDQLLSQLERYTATGEVKRDVVGFDPRD